MTNSTNSMQTGKFVKDDDDVYGGVCGGVGDDDDECLREFIFWGYLYPLLFCQVFLKKRGKFSCHNGMMQVKGWKLHCY